MLPTLEDSYQERLAAWRQSNSTGVVDESEVFSASRVQAVANKVTGKVYKSVKSATDKRCWATFDVCIDLGRDNCPYITVKAPNVDHAKKLALEKVHWRGVVLDVLCTHPGKSVRVG